MWILSRETGAKGRNMQTYKGHLLRKIYGIIFMLLTLVLGVLTTMQVWRLFLSAEKAAYTPESIWTYFVPISPFVIAWLLMIIGNVVLAYVFPEPKMKVKGGVDDITTLKRLKNRLPDGGQTVPKMKKFDVARRWIWTIVFVIAAFTTFVCAYYLLSESYSPRFQSDFFTAHGGVADRLVKISPWLMSTLLLFVAATLFDSFAVEEQIRLMKDAVAEYARKEKARKAENKTIEQVKQEEKAQIAARITEECIRRGESDKVRTLIDEALEKLRKEDEKYKLACEKTAAQRAKETESKKQAELCSKDRIIGTWVVRGILITAGIAFVVIGIVNGGMADVFEKAKNICTQCIGLG